MNKSLSLRTISVRSEAYVWPKTVRSSTLRSERLSLTEGCGGREIRPDANAREMPSAEGGWYTSDVTSRKSRIETPNCPALSFDRSIASAER